MLRLANLSEDDVETLMSRISYASCLSRLARLTEAEEQVSIVLAVVNEAENAKVYLGALKVLNFIRTRQLRNDESFEIASQRLSLCRSIYGDSHKTTTDALGYFAMAAHALDRHGEAEDAAREALKNICSNSPDKQFAIANAEYRLALILVKCDKLDEAEQLVSNVIARQTAILGQNDEHVIRALCLMANIQMLNDEMDQAESFVRQAVASANSLPENRIGIRATTYRRLAVILQQNKPEASVEAWNQSIGFRYQLLGNHRQVTSHLQILAGLHAEIGNLNEAAACYERAINMLEQMSDVNIQMKAACERYSRLLIRMDEPERAERYQQAADAVELSRANED